MTEACTEIKYLKDCKDFKMLKERLTSNQLMNIEEDIKKYKETNENYNNYEDVPRSVCWYMGMIDTIDFVEDYIL